MRKVDKFILDCFDIVACGLQRRGLLLTRLMFCITAAMLIVSLVSDRLGQRSVSSFLIDGVWFGFLTLVYLCRCHKYDGYPESVRMMRELNADALLTREFKIHLASRVLVGIIFIASVIELVFAQPRTWLDCVFFGLMLSWFNFNGSFYLGPGEFNKSKARGTPRDLVTADRGSGK